MTRVIKCVFCTLLVAYKQDFHTVNTRRTLVNPSNHLCGSGKLSWLESKAISEHEPIRERDGERERERKRMSAKQRVSSGRVLRLKWMSQVG